MNRRKEQRSTRKTGDFALSWRQLQAKKGLAQLKSVERAIRISAGKYPSLHLLGEFLVFWTTLGAWMMVFSIL